ncbi:hypothetical protein ACHAW5_003364 [Stephanodiscus triporus]|uniref:Ankyrin repeat protein n=1 Tax=Stephanodiscus triporus TaxID=2934178 RepID=A0ABD3QT14_9STRA
MSSVGFRTGKRGYAIYSNPADFQWFARKISRLPDLEWHDDSARLRPIQPPAPIVQVPIELVPESSSLVDCLNRTPLHVAAGMRANVATIQLLTDAYPIACSVRDEDGKTPLHPACDSACELFKGDKDRGERSAATMQSSR